MKNIFFTVLSVSVLAGSTACSSPQLAEKGVAQHNQTSIKHQVERGAFVVDVRTPEEFAQGSFPGAVNIPLSEVQSRVAEFKGKPSVIVFCRSGKRSAEAKSILENNGIQNVTNGVNTENMIKETT